MASQHGPARPRNPAGSSRNTPSPHRDPHTDRLPQGTSHPPPASWQQLRSSPSRRRFRPRRVNFRYKAGRRHAALRGWRSPLYGCLASGPAVAMAKGAESAKRRIWALTPQGMRPWGVPGVLPVTTLGGLVFDCCTHRDRFPESKLQAPCVKKKSPQTARQN